MDLNNQIKPIKKVFIGSDAELVILNGYKIIDMAPHGYTVRNYGSIGHDGHHWIGELRPNYSENPLDLITNMREIMLGKIKHNPKFADYTFRAGSFYQDKSLGGHVHISSDDPNFKKNDFSYFTRILDNYLGVCCILLENKEEGKKRRASDSYGFYGDFRLQPWGFETRTPSSWLSSPQIASSILCLAKVVMHEILNNPGFSFRIFDCYDNFHYMQTEKLLNRFPQIWQDIQKMQLYPKYKCYIDFIYTLISKKKEWTPERLKLKEAWGIISIPQIEKRSNVPRFKTISLDSIWKEKPNRKKISNNWFPVEDSDGVYGD